MKDAIRTRYKTHLIPAFKDNYLYIFEDTFDHSVIIIDPGSAPEVAEHISRHSLRPVAILNTHHHHDHIGGNKALMDLYQVPLFSPFEVRSPIPYSQLLKTGEFSINNFQFEILPTPGHTFGHISLYHEQSGSLFCGDTLFSLGCGRLFEGSPEMMWKSLTRLCSLPDDTLVYCAHEYTKTNLGFTDLHRFNDKLPGWDQARNQILKSDRTVPSSIAFEKLFNPMINFAFNPAMSIASSPLSNPDQYQALDSEFNSAINPAPTQLTQTENRFLQTFTKRRELRNLY